MITHRFKLDQILDAYDTFARAADTHALKVIIAAWRVVANRGDTVKSTNRAWPLSSILLLLFGAGLVLMGLYFIFLRPPLLPEDLRYMDTSQAQLQSTAPNLTVWLTQVFRVMGGYVAATGVLTVTLAVTSFRLHERAAAVGALLAGLASIAWMATINFLINSDFKWMLLGAAILWASSMALFWFERRVHVAADASESME